MPISPQPSPARISQTMVTTLLKGVPHGRGGTAITIASAIVAGLIVVAIVVTVLVLNRLATDNTRSALQITSQSLREEVRHRGSNGWRT